MRFLSKIRVGFYILLGLLIIAICIKEALDHGDFKVFLEASKLIFSQESIYNRWYVVSENNACLYFYSPLWALILWPLSGLPNFIPNLLWLFFNLFLLYRIWSILSAYVKTVLSPKQMQWLQFLCILLIARFLLHNIEMIQMTIFMLWGCLESMRLLAEKKIVKASGLLALVLNIKLLPLVLVPYLLYRGHFKAFGFVLLFTAVYLFSPALFVGWSHNMMLLQEWWSVINPSNAEHLLETELGPHSLTALIPTVFSETAGDIEINRNLFSLSKEQALMLLNLCRAALVLFSIYFFKWPPFKKAKSKQLRLRELAYLLLLIPLIFPRQHKYAFFMVLPAIFYLLQYILLRKASMQRTGLIFLLALSFILMTLTTDGLIGRELSAITQHFKTITWGTLLLIVCLIIADPSWGETQIKKETDD